MYYEAGVSDPYGPEPGPFSKLSTGERALGLASAVLLVVGLVAAVQHDGPRGNDPLDVNASGALRMIRDARDEAVRAGSARVWTEGRFFWVYDSLARTEFSSTMMDGAVDFGDDRGWLRERGDAVAGADDLPPIELRFFGDDLYRSLVPVLPGGDEVVDPHPMWVLDDSGSLMGAAAARSLAARGAFVPAEALDLLDAVGSDVRVVGRKDVRGVETAQFEAPLRTSRLPHGVRLALRSAGAAHESEARIGVWVDAGGLVRRIELSVDALLDQVNQDPGLVRVRYTNTMEFFEFGATVHVKVPPKDQVVEVRPRGTAPGSSPEPTGPSGPAAGGGPDDTVVEVPGGDSEI